MQNMQLTYVLDLGTPHPQRLHLTKIQAQFIELIYFRDVFILFKEASLHRSLMIPHLRLHKNVMS